MTDKCVCGSDSYSKILDCSIDGKSSVVECNNCGQKRTSPKPIDIDNTKDYYTNALDSNDRINRINLWKNFCNKSLVKIKKYINAGKLLDVGCNNGVFVKQAMKSGFDSFGIDLSSKAIEIGIKELSLGDKTLIGSLVSKKYPDNNFDIITYLHVMEHIEDANTELGEVHRILKNKGILYIEVPNFNSIWRRLSPKRWYGYSPHEHIWQFDEKSLVKIIKNNNFEILKVYTRYSMHHQVSSSLSGMVKLVVHIVSFCFSLGDNLIVIATKK